METNFAPTLIHSALFTCPDDGAWARSQASDIGDLAFVLNQGLPPWADKPEELASLS